MNTIRTKIVLTPEELTVLFTEAKRLLADNHKIPLGQLWLSAQKVLPPERQRTTIHSAALSNLNKRFKVWLKPALTSKRPYVRRTPLPALVPIALSPASVLNYCPGCGFDLRRVKLN